MLFNSSIFLFQFLPTVIIGTLVLQRLAPAYVLHFLVGGSLFFYGWWSPPHLLLIAVSIGFNFMMGRAISATRSTALLGAAIAANLALLGYFKYYNLFALGVHTTGGTWAPFRDIVLPLAISFFTFEQISYLVDCRNRTSDAAPIWHYMFFVCFFPKLIAGPIVRYSELAGQEFTSRLGVSARDFAPGLTLFVLGLGKKVLLADQAAVYVSPVFSAASAGDAVGIVDAWVGVLAYTAQIYFDFSGYSDMALGLALMFGLRLPLNFNSPYKSLSVIDFWRRWHVTLSRFLRDYLYIPLGGGRRGTLRRYTNLGIVMLLGGLWHGAGLTFLAWGLLHGIYLVINHLFRDLTNGWAPAGRFWYATWCAACWVLTFFSVVVAWVFFRAESFAAAFRLLGSMFGSGGPATLSSAQIEAIAIVVPLIALTLLAPNSNEIVRGSYLLVEAAPPAPPARRRVEPRSGWMVWRPTVPWAAGIGVIFLSVLAFLSRPSPFLYFQF